MKGEIIMAEKTIPEKKSENQVVKREITRHPENYITPLTDIYEENNGLRVMVDLPGVVKDGLSLNVENGVLTIEAHADLPQTGNYYIREFEPVSYYRQFELTDAIDQEKISAELKNGVLNLSLPRAEELKPRQIQVKFD